MNNKAKILFVRHGSTLAKMLSNMMKMVMRYNSLKHYVMKY